METYQQIKARHQADVDAFPLGACFSKQQLTEMMRKFGLPDDKTGYAQIVSLGAGCYIKKTDVPAWQALAQRHEDEMREFRKNREALTEALRYEFANHEYHFGNTPDCSVLAPLGLTWEEVQNDADLMDTYQEAKRLFYEDCEQNGWY